MHYKEFAASKLELKPRTLAFFLAKWLEMLLVCVVGEGEG
jgi:hypothetical protein